MQRHSRKTRSRRLAPISRALPLAVMLAVSACAMTPARVAPTTCRAGEQRMQRDALYLGTARPDGGRVSAADWDGFERDVLLPAFPAGFSVLDVSGHWRGADGSAVAEASRMIVILHADEARSEQAIAAVAVAYRRRFAQESVLRERSDVCASF